jgi:branched-subunit amino acid aminotransferase/4-amino-4-deoxychorismate lyase
LFRAEAHVERLRQSAGKLMRPIGREELPSRVDFLELLQRNQLSEARIRLTLSAGSVSPDAVESSWTVCATAAPLIPPAERMYREGAQVALSSYRVSPLDPLGGHKTTSYFPRLLGLREAQQKQCMEALWFTTRNTLAEGCISNVFVVKSGSLKTPLLDTPVLPGIARAVVLELARSMGIAVAETALSIDDLLDADEVFLTNVLMQVMPVTKIERREIADGKVGAQTRRLREAFGELVRRECAAE